jgi:hypothetical protein
MTILGHERPHAFHLGVEIVDVMQQQRFGKHRNFGRSELEFSVMTDDQVFDQHAKLGREIGEALQFIVQEAQADNDVA